MPARGPICRPGRREIVDRDPIALRLDAGDHDGAVFTRVDLHMRGAVEEIEAARLRGRRVPDRDQIEAGADLVELDLRHPCPRRNGNDARELGIDIHWRHVRGVSFRQERPDRAKDSWIGVDGVDEPGRVDDPRQDRPRALIGLGRCRGRGRRPTREQAEAEQHAQDPAMEARLRPTLGPALARGHPILVSASGLTTLMGLPAA
jgi:hypothetical protein